MIPRWARCRGWLALAALLIAGAGQGSASGPLSGQVPGQVPGQVSGQASELSPGARATGARSMGAQPAAEIAWSFETDGEEAGTLVVGPFFTAELEAAVADGDEAVVVWAGEPELQGAACVHPDDLPPMLGRSETFRRSPVGGAGAEGAAVWIRFVPRFAFVPQRLHTACLGAGFATGSAPRRYRFVPPSPRAPREDRPRIESVWPPAGPVPANLLRFYVTFSEPMWARDVGDHVALVDEDGVDVVDAFVDLPDGLWDPEGRRLTLVVHPGRVKRGVGPRRVMGPVLEEGGRFSLRVAGELSSRRGSTLGDHVEFDYTVTALDRGIPDPSRWTLEAPDGPRGALHVRFGERLDRPQLATALRVVDGDGELVAGSGQSTADGRSWSFVPEEPWRSGRYRLLVRPTLEDLAGNTPLALFDRDPAPSVPAPEAPPPEAATPGPGEGWIERTFRFP